MQTYAYKHPSTKQRDFGSHFLRNETEVLLLAKVAFSKSCIRRGKVSWGCQSSYQTDHNAFLFAKLNFFSGSFDKSRWNFIAQRNGKGVAYSTK